MELSVCIITKNQEAQLERCLSALCRHHFDIVVVDTGSTDHSKEVAERYTNQIYDFPWQNDFSLAKNYAVSKAKNNLVMVLDTDEYLKPLQVNELWKTVEANASNVGRITRYNQVEDNRVIAEKINRIYDRRLYHYEGRIHEQLVDAKGNTQLTTYLTNVAIEHDGYVLSKEELEEKVKRNHQLLMEELQDHPGDPYLEYQLAKTYFFEQNYAAAAEYLEQVLAQDLNPKLDYVKDAVETYGYVLLHLNRIEDAASYENIYEEFGDTADFQFLMGLIYMNNQRFEEAICEFEKAAVNPLVKAQDINEFSAYYNAGVICECRGDTQAALSYYQKCQHYNKAEARIQSLMNRKQ